MRVLAADSSTAYCSVALHDGSNASTIAETTVLADRRHSELLLTITDDILRNAGIDLKDVDLFAVGTGPGSFTGVRIGIATWQGLALGQGKRLIGVCTLEAMASAAGAHSGVTCPVIDARMAEVFAAMYRQNGGMLYTEAAPWVGSPQSVIDRLPPDAVVFGDGFERYRAEFSAKLPQLKPLPAELQFPRAASLARLAAERIQEPDAAADPSEVHPLYLRKSQAENVRESALAKSES